MNRVTKYLFALLLGALPLHGEILSYTFQSHAGSGDVLDTGGYLHGLIAAGDLVTGTIQIANLGDYSATASSSNFLSLTVDGYTFSTANGQAITWFTSGASTFFIGGVTAASWPSQFPLLGNSNILIRLDGLLNSGGNFNPVITSSSVTAGAVVANSWNNGDSSYNPGTDQYFVRAFFPQSAPVDPGPSSSTPEPASAGLSMLGFLLVALQLRAKRGPASSRAH